MSRALMLCSSSAALAAILCLVPLSAIAQTQEPKNETKKEESPATAKEEKKPSFFAETTVTATGSKRDVFQVATPVTVVSEAEIARKVPENPADMLREEPGVDVTGVGPNQTRPIIRGQRGLRVLFLENGLRLNNARRQTDFGEIAGLVDLDSVSTVEVVRGPASVLYGSDAVGGVLNVVSREATIGEKLSGSVNMTYSNAGDLARGGARVEGSAGRFTYQLGASLRDAGEYEAPAGRFGQINLPRETKVLDSGVRDRSIWGSFGFAPTDRSMLRFRFNSYDSKDTGFGYVPGNRYGITEDVIIRILYPSQQFSRYTLSYFGSPEHSVLATTTNLQAYYQSNERELVNKIDINIGPIAPHFPDSSVVADTRNFTDLDTWGVRADAVKVIGSEAPHILTYGLETYTDDSYNTDFSKTTTILRFPGPPYEVRDESIDSIANAPNAKNLSSGVFVQDEMNPFEKLRVTAGLRYHDVRTRAKATPDWNIQGLDFQDHDVVGALTATYQIAGYLNGLVSYGTAFRAPNIIERLFNGPTPEGDGYQILNRDLSSERSGNWDAGLKYQRADAYMEAVYFRNDVRKGIIQDFLSPSDIAQLPQDVQDAIRQSHARYVVQEINSDRLRYEGVEVALGYHLVSGLTIGGNYTHINSSRLGATTILPPDDVYSSKMFGYVRYQPATGRYWIEYDVRHNGNAKANIDPDEPEPPVGATLPSFTVQNVGAGLRVFEGYGLTHDVTLWVDNLANSLYAEFSNASFFRPEPGRTFKATYRLGF